MPDASPVERPIRIEDYLSPHDEGQADLVGTLRVEAIPGTMRVSVHSVKFKNSILNWKKFVFDVLPFGAGALTAMPTSSPAAVIIGLQALRSAVGLLDVELPAEAANVIMQLAGLERAARNVGRSVWIPVSAILAPMKDQNESTLRAVLSYLARLGTLQFDLTEENVRLVEEIRFKDAA